MQASGTSLKAEPLSSNSADKARAKNLRFLPFFAPTLIFSVAFALRYLYNAVFMEHRIAHFGDAYNFLRSGTCLLETAYSSHNIFEFFHKIYHAAAPQAQILQSMTSMKLMDRLLIDGPVYPAYLALVQWISGINPASPIFDAHSVQICLCNSLVDAIACVIIYIAGRFAFNRKAGLIAGLLFATYPAAIINTQHCYSEPFSYFLLSIWTCFTLFALLRHVKKTGAQAFAWFGIGLFTALMMLAKPAFILLPPLAFVGLLPVFFLQAKSRGFSLAAIPLKQMICAAALMVLGLALPLTPWACFNKAASGQYSIFVNRVPSFNIFHGNQISTDGWRCYPFYGTFPGDSNLVISSLIEDAKKQPLVFAGLQFKKIARLWSGVWNEYHYRLFGVPIEIQSLYHQLLLLMGSVSLLAILFGTKNKTYSRSFSASIVLGVIVLFHFAYIPFEAISRYAITAMPAICILIGGFLSQFVNTRFPVRQFIMMLVSATVSFVILAASGTTANLIAAFFPQLPLWTAPVLSVCFDVLCLLLCFNAVRLFFNITIRDAVGRRAALVFAGLLFLLVAAVAAFYTIQSHDWKEWQCELKDGSSVSQSIRLPVGFSFSTGKTAFVLMDLESQSLAPQVELRLNGQKLSEAPVPLAEFQPNNSDILQCLAIQAEGMSRDVRVFRNWWVVPFPVESLKAGAENVIELRASGAPVNLYGDFCESKSSGLADGSSYLPSLRSFSYTKGFTTFDHRDPRVFEKVDILGKTGSISSDLSQSAGYQYGRYRIRIFLPVDSYGRENGSGNLANTNAKMPQPVTLLGDNEVQLVTGNNPATFVPKTSSISLQSGLPSGTRFYFSCSTRNVSGTHSCFVGLSFTGADENGVQKAWNSKWQPIGISSSNMFKVTSFSDIIPDEVLRWQNLQVHPMFSPFQPDFLFLKRREALKSSIEVRGAHLSFLPPLSLPPLETRSWQLY